MSDTHLCNTLKLTNEVRTAKITPKKLNCKTATLASLLGINCLLFMPASFPVEQQETQIYRDYPVMLKFKYLRQKRTSEGNPREAMRQAPHSNLLEVGNLRRPRVAVCSFLFSQIPRN